jgi:hypothetical protein
LGDRPALDPGAAAEAEVRFLPVGLPEPPNALALELAKRLDLLRCQPGSRDEVEQVAVEIDLRPDQLVGPDLTLALGQTKPSAVTTRSEIAGSVNRSSRT